MNGYFRGLHQCMQKEMEQHKGALDTTSEIENCFRIAMLYFESVTQWLRDHPFCSERSEIYFFKKLKPLFTSELQYLKLIYHALLFHPPEKECALRFWGGEYRRLDRFLKEHAGFKNCYFTDKHRLDSYYFLRRNFEPCSPVLLRVPDRDWIATNGDYPAATLLALQKYRRYCLVRMKQL
jgi:hypothetical protein